MLDLLKKELERVGPKHISKTVKRNTKLYEFIINQTSHISTKKLSEIIYLVINDLSTKPLCYCGKELKFESLNKGYTTYCSVKCARNSSETVESFSEKLKNRTDKQKKESNKKRIKTNLKKYGVGNVSGSKLIKEKKRKTLNRNYGVDSPLQSNKIKEKVEKTNLERYGSKTYLSSSDAQKKIKNTNLERYGVENPMQCDIIKNKSLQNQIENNGGIGFQINREQKLENLDWNTIREKVKKTNVERYGVEMPFQSELIQRKIKQTNLKKYGVETIFSYKPFIYNNSQRYIKQYISKLIKEVSEDYIPLFDIDDYNGQGKYGWVHILCRNEFDYTTNGNFPKPICPKCYPKYFNISQMEIDLFESVTHTNKIQSDRTVLEGKELDILIPDKNLAIEFNGIYWHSELNGKDKNYHLNKSIECEQKDIQLIHVFETEWVEKQSIVKSIINAKLGIFKKRLYGRKCIIKEISPHIKNTFLEENHIQGQDKSSIKLGLFYDNELVSVMTFGNSRYNKKYQYEMHRFCSKLGYQIIGGASKLWKYFIRKYSPESVITYADRRYSNGMMYKKLGFNKLGESKPNYFYFKGNSGLMSRIQFQKHKLKDKLDDFDPELSEWENMKLNEYDRIWDCGNFVFNWKNKKYS